MKKLLCLFLCLIMIIPASVSLSESKISSITVTITVPKAGSTTATKPVVTVAAGNHCRLWGAVWITDDFEHELPDNIVLEGGKIYHIGVMLDPDSGYQFDNPLRFSIGNGIFNKSFTPKLWPDGSLDFVVDVLILADQITVSGGVYQLNHAKLTATLISAADKNAKKLTIPNTVSANGKTYKVTEIKSKACSGMKKLATVTIGANVNKIGAQAFAKCKKLSKITIKNARMAKNGFGSKCFSGIKSKAAFKVPKKMVEKYKDWILKNGKAPKNSKITK